jgi:hypothetical protein
MSTGSNGMGSFVWHVAATANKSAFLKKLLAKEIALAEEHVAGKHIPLVANMPVVFANFPLRISNHVTMNRLSSIFVSYISRQSKSPSISSGKVDSAAAPNVMRQC